MDRIALRERLDDACQRRDQWAAEGMALVEQWHQAFPHGTIAFRLVRMTGESNTLLRWRSDARVRGGRVELGDIPEALDALPSSVRRRVWRFEQQRIAINFEYAMAAYRAQRLDRLEAQRAALAALRGRHDP